MTEALNPSKEADIENLKRQLAELRESFQDLGSQAKALEKPVAEKAAALDIFIEQTREHTGEIAIQKALCSWEITRINLFTNVMSKLMELQQLMAGLKNESEDLKTYLRANPYTAADPVKLSVSKILEAPGERTLKAVEKELRELVEQYPDTAASGPKETLVSLLNGKPETKISEAAAEIKAVLSKLPESPVDNASRDFAKIQRIYNEGKAKAEQYRSDAEKAIKDLQQLIEQAEKDLVATVNKVPFHDSAVKEQIIKQMEEAISRMQGERKTMLFKLQETWKAITEQFSSESRNHLFLEVNRLGYAIFEYEGSLPYVTTFRLTSLVDLHVKPLAPKKGAEASSSTDTGK